MGLPDTLHIKTLNKLIEKGRAVFFNYSGILPDIANQDLLNFIKGEGNAIVDTSLYTKNGNYDYRLQVKDWLHTEEAKKYLPLLLNICHKENLLRYISKHLN